MCSVFPSLAAGSFPSLSPMLSDQSHLSLVRGSRRYTQHSLPALTGYGLVTTDALGIDPATQGLTSGLGHGLVLDHVRLRSLLGHCSSPLWHGALFPAEGMTSLHHYLMQ